MIGLCGIAVVASWLMMLMELLVLAVQLVVYMTKAGVFGFSRKRKATGMETTGPPDDRDDIGTGLVEDPEEVLVDEPEEEQPVGQDPDMASADEPLQPVGQYDEPLHVVEDSGNNAAEPPRDIGEDRGRAYTAEQEAIVQQILDTKATGLPSAHCMILGVNVKEIEDDQETVINKAFRRLSIRVHPDKNPAPLATEAFRALKLAHVNCLEENMQRQMPPQHPQQQEDELPNPYFIGASLGCLLYLVVFLKHKYLNRYCGRDDASDVLADEEYNRHTRAPRRRFRFHRIGNRDTRAVPRRRFRSHRIGNDDDVTR
jgi:hypothetical protein